MGLVLICLMLTSPAAFSSQQQLDFNSSSNSNIRMRVIGYDNGSPVTVPLIKNAPFLTHGVNIDEIRIVMNWTGTGTNVQWSTFSMSGAIAVNQTGEEPGSMFLRYSTTLAKTSPNSSYVVSLKLGTDICKAADIIAGAWYFQFKILASATILDTLGHSLTRTATPLIGWLEITYSSSFGFSTTW